MQPTNYQPGAEPCPDPGCGGVVPDVGPARCRTCGRRPRCVECRPGVEAADELACLCRRHASGLRKLVAARQELSEEIYWSNTPFNQ